MSTKPLLSNQHFQPCSTYKGKLKWHVLLPQTLYSNNLLLLYFFFHSKHPSPFIFYIGHGKLYVPPLTTVIVYLSHLPSRLTIIWGKICLLLGETAWVLKPILACLVHFPAVWLWANYLISPRLSYDIPEKETMMSLHQSIRMSE